MNCDSLQFVISVHCFLVMSYFHRDQSLKLLWVSGYVPTDVAKKLVVPVKSFVIGRDLDKDTRGGVEDDGDEVDADLQVDERYPQLLGELAKEDVASAADREKVFEESRVLETDPEVEVTFRA